MNMHWLGIPLRRHRAAHAQRTDYGARWLLLFIAISALAHCAVFVRLAGV